MQTKHTDASERFVSLDDIYYYGGGIGLDQKVVAGHKPRTSNELEIQPGDKISVAGNHWNGMSKGTNRRTNKVNQK
jgi:glycoprotein 6-alpha-L-fucosyltransferase